MELAATVVVLFAVSLPVAIHLAALEHLDLSGVNHWDLAAAVAVHAVVLVFVQQSPWLSFPIDFRLRI